MNTCMACTSDISDNMVVRTQGVVPGSMSYATVSDISYATWPGDASKLSLTHMASRASCTRGISWDSFRRRMSRQ